MKNGYIAFVLDEDSRNRVLAAFGTKYPDVIAHHITLTFGVPEPEEDIMKAFNSVFNDGEVKVTGYADDGKVEVLIVSINGTTIRADDKFSHLTLSIDRSKGAKPVHANNVLSNCVHSRVYPVYLSGKIEFIST